MLNFTGSLKVYVAVSSVWVGDFKRALTPAKLSPIKKNKATFLIVLLYCCQGGFHE